MRSWCVIGSEPTRASEAVTESVADGEYGSDRACDATRFLSARSAERGQLFRVYSSWMAVVRGVRVAA